MGWPAVRAMVVPHDPGLGVMPGQVYKGLATEQELAAALQACAAMSGDGCAHLETDLRAHMNPQRMASVAMVGLELVKRLKRAGYGWPLSAAA